MYNLYCGLVNRVIMAKYGCKLIYNMGGCGMLGVIDYGLAY